jgi:hypothetical protein
MLPEAPHMPPEGHGNMTRRVLVRVTDLNGKWHEEQFFVAPNDTEERKVAVAKAASALILACLADAK